MHSDNWLYTLALLASRDTLHNDLEKLRDEQRYMENDLSNIQIRWHSLREEKVKAANMLQDVKKAEEELDRLAEEKSQLELDEMVRIFCFKVPILHVIYWVVYIHWRLLSVFFFKILTKSLVCSASSFYPLGIKIKDLLRMIKMDLGRDLNEEIF